MSDFPRSQEFAETYHPPSGLSSEFRTYLGGKTAYGKAYNKGIVHTALSEFLWSHGGTASRVHIRTKAGVPITTTEVEAIAWSITNKIDSEEFRGAAKIKNIDEVEEKQMSLLLMAVQNQMASLGSKISITQPEDEEELLKLQHELELIKTLVIN